VLVDDSHVHRPRATVLAVHEARQRRHVGEDVHVPPAQHDQAPGLALQARTVQPLQAGDVEEPIGVDVRERLLRDHPHRLDVLEARAGRRRHGPAVKVHGRLCQLVVDYPFFWVRETGPVAFYGRARVRA